VRLYWVRVGSLGGHNSDEATDFITRMLMKS
jgi:hypothetical protein